MNREEQIVRLKYLLTKTMRRGFFNVVTDLTEKDIEETVTSLETFRYVKIEMISFARSSSLDIMIEELSLKYPSSEIDALSNIIFTATAESKNRIQLRLLTYLFHSIACEGNVIIHLMCETEFLPLLHEEIKLIQKAIECSGRNVAMIFFTKEVGNIDGDAVNLLHINNSQKKYKNMGNRLSKVHITYKHDTEHDAAVSQLEVGFLKNGIDYSIDKDDIQYRDDIEAYEKEIGGSDRVVMFVTDGYLKSLACMFEMTCIFDNTNYFGKIYPIVHLKDISRDFKGLSEIKEYWIGQKEQRLKAIEKNGESEFIQKDLAKIEKLLGKLDDFWSYIVNFSTGEYDLLIANHAELLMKKLLESMSSVSATNVEDFVPSGDTAPNVTRVVNQGDKSTYVEKLTGDITIN